MKARAIRLSTLALAGLCLGFGFQNPYFIIQEKDVALHLPPEFPKPIYRFKNNQPKASVFLLGRKLFYDNILSKDNSVNCGTCHQRIAAFAHIDHALSHGIYAKIGTRNVPSLQNLIWKDTYMWDGRVANLEQQPVNPITNPIEMDESMEHVVKKLANEPLYRSMFYKAFSDSGIKEEYILKALTQFTGLMISANSRYDKYIRNQDSLTIQEKEGLALFTQKCAGCHQAPLFTNNSYRNNGLRPDTSINDLGRGAITKKTKDAYLFKVPSLRNIDMTYPYMHDGRFRNLQHVVAYYANPKNFTQTADPELKKIGQLSETEQKYLIAFLKTLKDKEFLYDRRFVDPAMENSN